ncbi:tripartite tricarboxylate transporter TctB family protein [Parasedimentitalea maritima]|uniref:DUF1468 domain-containing protein n=1 Tax=Parasedimentitalea maritima TaxID=2578117 RepID=A0A6A4RF54_9RHOB|nr:tripartite tricarboxylate transporter TctB family protein [Zongyanglinia marina]KAE9627967.1 hypothetical protein GP644_17910 [Zongyanglinia marina]
MQQNRLDIISGFALTGLALTLYFYLIPNFVAENEMGAMSPRFFPRLGALIIGAGGILLVIASSWAISRQKGVESGVAHVSDGRLANAILIVLAMAGFILLFQWFGYFYAAPPFLAALVLIFGGRNPLSILLVSAFTTATLYAVFSFGLNLPLF